MKRIPSLISILLFMAVLVVPSLVWGIRKISGNLPEDHMIETEENREPAEWPKKFSSNLPSEIEAYYNDRVPFRSFMVRAYSVVDGNTEGFYRKNLQPVLIAMSGRKGDIEVSGLTDLYNDKEVLTQNADSEKPKEIKPKSDQYVEVDRKDPSCGDAGYVTYAKKDGSDEYTEEIPALGHDYADAGVFEPTYLKYGYHLYKCKRCGWEHKAEFTEKLIDDSYFPENISNRRVIVGRYNWLYYTGDNSKDYYTGANVMSEEVMMSRLNQLKELQDICEAQGKTIVFIVWPNKEQVYPEYMPTYEIVNTVKREPAFEQYVKTNSNVKFIYPIDDLKKGKVLADTYYPYDTHWNNWGSFIGTLALYKELGYEVPDYQDIQIAEIPCNSRGLVATGMLDGNNFTDDCDYQVVYRPGARMSWTDGEKDLSGGYTDIYRAGSVDYIYDKELVLIGDSFRISMIPYLEKDFKRIAVYSRNTMLYAATDIKNADVIVLSAVERYDNDLFAKLEELKGYLTQ